MPALSLRAVRCILCFWEWGSGAPLGSLARCPRCHKRAGVERFVIIKPDDRSVYVMYWGGMEEYERYSG